MSNEGRQEQDDWNAFLAKLLSNSLTRPTSEAIAQAVRKHLPESERHGRRVSKSLVDKWRSTSSKASRQPTDIRITLALVKALEELGIFQGNSNAKESRRKLFELLGYEEPAPTEDQILSAEDQILNDAWNNVLRELREIPNREALSKPELLLAVSCLQSQQILDTDRQRFFSDVKNEGHFVMFLEWDARPTLKAQARRNELVEELQAPEVAEYFNEHLRAGLNVDLVFGIHNLQRNSDYDEKRCVSIIERMADNLTAGLSPEFTRNNDRPRLRVSWNERGILGQAFSLHLYPGEECRGWKLIRHPHLFKKIKGSRATTFCSPLRDDEMEDVLERLGIRWETIETPHWEVNPSRTTDQALPNVQHIAPEDQPQIVH
ncbi:MAG TPA: hypothetical protein VJ302_28375 [Blastocatellia bacterium]|nr:hypothetical protein [Blastocatellia bacterium]